MKLSDPWLISLVVTTSDGTTHVFDQEALARRETDALCDGVVLPLPTLQELLESPDAAKKLWEPYLGTDAVVKVRYSAPVTALTRGKSPSPSTLPGRKATWCRSLVAIAQCLLPEDIRRDTYDEWIDEIECAAAAGQPVLRRTLSILVRSLFPLAWRARRPAAARRNGS